MIGSEEKEERKRERGGEGRKEKKVNRKEKFNEAMNGYDFGIHSCFHYEIP